MVASPVTPKPVTAPTVASPAAVVLPSCTATAGEQVIIQRESGGNVNAYNPVDTSTGHAFGIGQLTDELRDEIGARLGIDPNTTNYCDQLALMRDYIAERYGSTANAVAHEESFGWY